MLFSSVTDTVSVAAVGVTGEAQAVRLNTSNIRLKIVFFIFLLIVFWRMDEVHTNMFPILIESGPPISKEFVTSSWFPLIMDQ